MGMFGTAGKQLLNQLGVNLLGVDVMGQQRRRAEQEAIRRAQLEAAGLLRPQPGAMRPAQIGNEEGADIAAAFAPQMEQGPSRERNPQEIAAGIADLAARTPGFNPKPFVDLAQYAKPEIAYDRGMGYDKATGERRGAFHPELAEGERPLFDDAGNIVAVQNLGGVIESMAAREEAKARGKTFGELRDVPDGKGGSRLMTGREYMGGAGSGGEGGLGYTPPAAKLAADKVVAESQATAGITLPTDTATVDAAIGSIDSLLKDPVLPKRTGMMGLLPAVPGTEGAGFDAQLKQLTGQIFLDAYASLKGAGAITEQEGKAATAAKARLDKAQTEQDFRTALGELRVALDAGKRRLATRAGRPAPSSGAGQRPAAISQVPLADRMAEARRRGLIK